MNDSTGTAQSPPPAPPNGKKGSNNTSSPNHTRERIVEDFAPEEFHQLLDQIAETEEERAHSPNPQKEKNQGPNQGPEKNH